MRYVDGTLLLAKEDDINYIFGKFNSFHKNLKFTVDRFEENNVHFLDIAIDKIDTDLYHKPIRQVNTLVSTVVSLGIIKPHG